MKLLKFTRPSCPPCTMVTNYLNDKGVETVNINVYEDGETANKYRIQTSPVLILVDDNEDVVDQVFGYNPDGIEDLLSKLK